MSPSRVGVWVEPPGAREKKGRDPQVVFGRGQGRSVFERCPDNVSWLSETLSGKPQDGGAIDESVGGGNSGSLRGKECFPLCKPCVGGENNGSLSVPGGDDAEQIVGCL